jgi:hypothetical protein
VWLYADTGRAEAVAELSGQIFWLVIPSLVLFITLRFSTIGPSPMGTLPIFGLR